MMQTVVRLFKRRALVYGGFLTFFIVLGGCGSNPERDNLYRQAKTMPELKVPEDLQQPPENKTFADIPEQLDSGDIPKDLEAPPPLSGIDLEAELAKEKAEAAAEKAAKAKPGLQSEMVYESNNTQLLRAKAGIDMVWEKVAVAVKKLGFKVVDSNRGKYYYEISRDIETVQKRDNPLKPLEPEEETPTESYFVYVEPAEDNTEITVRNREGKIEGSALANQLLLQIKQQIESSG